MELLARNDLNHSPIRRRRNILAAGSLMLFAAIAVTGTPVAAADAHAGGESGAVTGAGFGPSAGVGGPSSYTGGSTSNNLCHQHCTGASVGVGGPSSYTGGSTANNYPGGTASQGVGDVSSYTGQGTSGAPQNGTNATTRTGNYGPGH
ncbi:hypothetical protein [Mycolicibacterium aichiense]|uniref:Uncharacterized protein n=1 Tax=Mycolicibacterium aichiense TaxID=1799 RepID=A0AAD1HK50_9MYCO|nr:hypothetical protein [Mycolicibacterium aichiense]MCV7017803.1 hypothetical protein [Mycolicibacterium aichiense]BBX06581.1 hypothetical protein MAIC_13840 [Mycolicibacterium aichiense]STZ24083.1 Uncharacterised protein [Mycolicibacterium aichiense]